MSEEKEKKEKRMIQVSVSVRKDKHTMLQAWADERDDSVANICRGWIYTGLADLQEALGRFEVMAPPVHYDEPQMQIPQQHQQQQQPPEGGSA